VSLHDDLIQSLADCLSADNVKIVYREQHAGH